MFLALQLIEMQSRSNEFYIVNCSTVVNISLNERKETRKFFGTMCYNFSFTKPLA